MERKESRVRSRLTHFPVSLGDVKRATKSTEAALVYGTLCEVAAWKTGASWYGSEKLAEMCALERRAYLRARHALESAGLITVESRSVAGQGSTSPTITVTRWRPAQEGSDARHPGGVTQDTHRGDVECPPGVTQSAHRSDARHPGGVTQDTHITGSSGTGSNEQGAMEQNLSINRPEPPPLLATVPAAVSPSGSELQLTPPGDNPASTRRLPGEKPEPDLSTKVGRDRHYPKPSPTLKDYPPAFLDFWRVYPRHVAKPAAYKAWRRHVVDGTAPAEIESGAVAYAIEVNRNGTAPEYIAHAATWLNASRFSDVGPAHEHPDTSPNNPSNGRIKVAPAKPRDPYHPDALAREVLDEIMPAELAAELAGKWTCQVVNGIHALEATDEASSLMVQRRILALSAEFEVPISVTMRRPIRDRLNAVHSVTAH